MDLADFVLGSLVILGATWLLSRRLPTEAARLVRLRELHSRGDAAYGSGMLPEAEELYLECVRFATKHFGDATPHAAAPWYRLILVRLALGQYEAGVEAGEHAIRCAAPHDGFEQLAAHAREQLARAHALLGAFEKTAALLDEAEAIRRGLDPPSVDPENALRLCDETRDLDTFWFGTDGPYAASLALIRSKAFARLGRDVEALEQARRAVALERSKYPDHHPLVANAERQLATLVDGAERRSLLDHVVEVMRAHDADETEEVERLRADA